MISMIAIESTNAQNRLGLTSFAKSFPSIETLNVFKINPITQMMIGVSNQVLQLFWLEKTIAKSLYSKLLKLDKPNKL